jgi:sugar/nucleoside kinase (ribokinase family)
LGQWGDLVVEVPARRARAIDETGAGDAYFAGVLATLWSRSDVSVPSGGAVRDMWAAQLGRRTRLSRAMRFGAELGARAVRAIGATVGLHGADLARLLGRG